jgi:hypothetical protein
MDGDGSFLGGDIFLPKHKSHAKTANERLFMRAPSLL